MKSKGLQQYKDIDMNITYCVFEDGTVKQRLKIDFRVAHRIDNNNSYKTHREHILKYAAEYYSDHEEQVQKRRLDWDRSISGQQSKRKEYATRKQFGFNTLNDPFPGCEGHHINKSDVIYIPMQLHHSIWHSVTNEVNMNEINTLAIDYLLWGVNTWQEQSERQGNHDPKAASQEVKDDTRLYPDSRKPYERI